MNILKKKINNKRKNKKIELSKYFETFDVEEKYLILIKNLIKN